MGLKFQYVRLISVLLIAVALSGCQKKQDSLAWTSIDVNTPYTQADAHLLTFDVTNHVLIDTGSRQSGEKLVNFLQSKKCNSIQTVIITHGHRDHYGGIVPLLQSGIAIGSVYFNPPPADLVTNEPWGCSNEELAEIRTELQKRNIPLKAMDKGTEWFLGKNAVMRVICTFNGIDTPVGRTDINDTSIVIMLTHESIAKVPEKTATMKRGPPRPWKTDCFQQWRDALCRVRGTFAFSSHKNIKITFAADLNRAMGDYLTTNCPDLLRADILKFPHHGTESFPNDSFFAAVNAKTIIVPAPKELWLSERSARARQLTKDCKVYVNGIEGNITVISDGTSLRIYSEKSPATSF